MKKENSAAAKLRGELADAKKSGDRKAKAVAEAVCATMIRFAEQNEEFARAVVQSDKTLAAVCAESVKNAGEAISDIEVYKRAVGAYFPGAQVDCVMTIRMSEHEGTGEPETAKSQTSGDVDVLSLDLFDLMGG